MREQLGSLPDVKKADVARKMKLRRQVTRLREAWPTQLVVYEQRASLADTAAVVLQAEKEKAAEDEKDTIVRRVQLNDTNNGAGVPQQLRSCVDAAAGAKEDSMEA